MKKSILKRSLLTFAAFTMVTACSSKEVDTTVQEEKETPVKVAEVKMDSMKLDNEIVGKAEADANVSVVPKMAGELMELTAEKGDEVKKGDVLAKIDAGDLGHGLELEKTGLAQAEAQLKNAEVLARKAEQGLENAKASLRQATLNAGTQTANADGANAESANDTTLKIQLEDATQHRERMEALYQAGAVSKQEYDSAVSGEKRAKLALQQGQVSVDQAKVGIKVAEEDVEQAKVGIEQAKVGVQQAQIRVKQAQDRFDDTFVKATQSGEIVNVNAKVGDTVSNQQPLLTIVSINPIVVTASVSAEQLDLFTKGSEINIDIPALGKKLPGKVTYVAPIANDSGLYTIEAEVTNKDKKIKPGMVATFVIDEVLVKEALLVPTEAIIEDADSPKLFVIENNKAVEKKIEVIQSQTDYTAVRGDLKAGDQVVVKGQNTLADGSKVNIIKGDK